VLLPHVESIADGLLAVRIGALPFAHHRAYLDEVVLVGDEAIRRAVRFLLDRMKLVAEPSGAITAAALLSGKIRPNGGPVAVVLSGGNVAWGGLSALLSAG
jgi:threo-3-hydroxy-L-aspartate ammonia-lyase